MIAFDWSRSRRLCETRTYACTWSSTFKKYLDIQARRNKPFYELRVVKWMQWDTSPCQNQVCNLILLLLCEPLKLIMFLKWN